MEKVPLMRDGGGGGGGGRPDWMGINHGNNGILTKLFNRLDASYTWLIIYFLCNLVLTLYNKALLTDFPFPYTLTAIHAFSGSVGCLLYYLRGSFTLAHLSPREVINVVAFSMLYAINIVVSNVSLQLVTIPFHQIVRATTPLFVILISVCVYGRSYSRDTYLSLIPVVCGVGLATAGDYYFTTTGFVMTVLGALLAAIKTVTTNRMQRGRLKLHPMDLLIRMSPLACLQALFYAYLSGEHLALLDHLRLTSEAHKDGLATLGLRLGCNGILAFALNVVSFTANKKTSALTMTVAANVKQVLSIMIAIVAFKLYVTFLNGLGILITLIGGMWYAKIEFADKAAARRASVLMDDDEDVAPPTIREKV